MHKLAAELRHAAFTFGGATETGQDCDGDNIPCSQQKGIHKNVTLGNERARYVGSLGGVD